MVIKKIQFIQMGEVASQNFICETTAQIIKENSSWKQKETLDTKEKFVQDLVTYGQKCLITKSENLSKFVSCFVNSDLIIPLPQNIENMLRQNDIDEDHRIETFYIQMKCGRQKLKLIEI